MPARVTISGHPGSGTSTLVSGICQKYNWKMLNGGQVFRDMATSREMTLEEFSQYCMEDESVDKQLDEMLSNVMLSQDSPDIIESRLAGWWAFNHKLDCPRIWIDVSEEVRATRVVNREGGSHSEQLALIRERMKYDGLRYNRLYGIDIDSKEPYTCVIESDNLDPEEVLETVIDHLEGYF
ncbi:MAG: cytidylate kinase family protein [Candidatus Thermoplasmatota archaeon]|nr:cytidylate kinase family protein [Candidatus Thermoplasmatota archaeon]